MKFEQLGNIKLYNGDCMEVMKTFKDKQFSLAIVDPPYGIGLIKTKAGNWGIRKEAKGDMQKDWDFQKPTKQYFDELFRVSKNQIIWGANHFIETLNKNSSCWIVWDKQNGTSYFADSELAYTSFDTAVRNFKMPTVRKDRIHECQKPIELYKWLLDNYAKEGDTILDTHFGSLSIGIACHDLKFDLTAIELDKDYYEMAKKRLINHQKQLTLF